MFLLTSLQHNILLHIKQHIFHHKMNSRKNNNKKLETKPPKITSYKQHSFQDDEQHRVEHPVQYRSFISIIFSKMVFDAVQDQMNECRSFISIIISNIIKDPNLWREMYRSFISIIVPLVGGHRRYLAISQCQSFISIIVPLLRNAI